MEILQIACRKFDLDGSPPLGRTPSWQICCKSPILSLKKLLSHMISGPISKRTVEKSLMDRRGEVNLNIKRVNLGQFAANHQCLLIQATRTVVKDKCNRDRSTPPRRSESWQIAANHQRLICDRSSTCLLLLICMVSQIGSRKTV